MYLLKLALRPFRLAPMSQLVSSAGVGLLLLVLGFLVWMQQGLQPILSRLQGEQVVTAYLSSSVQARDELSVLKNVQHAMSGTSFEAKLVGGTEFIRLIREPYPELGHQLEGLGPETSGMIPRYISVVGVFSDAVFAKLKTVHGIENVELSKDRYHHIVGAFSVLRWVTAVLVMAVGLSLGLALVHWSRMNSHFHREALLLLKHWGAGSGLLVIPGVIAGVFVGLGGGLFALAGWLVLGDPLIRHIRSFSILLKSLPLVHAEAGVWLLLLGGLLGLCAGLIGSTTGAAKRSQGSSV